MKAIAVIGLFVTLAFCSSLLWNRYSLWTGFWFDCMLALLALSVAMAAIQYQHVLLLRILFAVLLMLFLLIILLGVYILAIFFLMNARKVMKKEGRRFANMLTLFAGISLILYIGITLLIRFFQMPVWLSAIWTIMTFILAILFMHLIIYLTTMFLNNILKPRYNKDYVVILGSGLIDGKAPPLLQRRIDKGISFAKKQKKKTGKQAYLIFSGGQGRDEPCSEAFAMHEYAKTVGIDEEYVFLEEKSTNTKENILFSQDIMQKNTPDKKYNCVLVTNNFHIMRAGLLARKVGLKVAVLGCKTAGYYLPNAVMREYIAYLSLHKKRVIVVGVLLLAFMIITWLFENNLF